MEKEVVEKWAVVPSDYSIPNCVCSNVWRISRAYFEPFGNDYRIVHKYLKGFFKANTVFDTKEEAQAYHEYRRLTEKCICPNDLRGK